MCGISCIFSTPAQNSCLSATDVDNFLTNRGPDDRGTITSKDGLIFTGCVLWQQGSSLTPQPAVCKNIILLFNGDIYNAEKECHTSDTTWLLQQLEGCEDDRDAVNLFQNIKGPYSVIFYNETRQELYFARDSLGRNSLLIENDDEVYRISSVSCISNGRTTVELPPLGIYKFDTKTTNEVKLYPWKALNEENMDVLETLAKQCKLNLVEIANPVAPDWLLVKEIAGTYDFFKIMNNIDEGMDLFPALLQCKDVNETVTRLTQLLTKSVEERVRNTPNYCTECLKLYLKGDLNERCSHSKIGILFSGGIDCTMLAVLAHKFVNDKDPIDLINVAFQNAKENLKQNWDVPDRLSALESLRELQKLFPARTWNLIEVNITRDELNRQLKSHIRHLIHPLRTVLDESLGCAFWFAARGKGLINGAPHQSNCRVILVGSGADELFGGYTRHRNAYLRCKGEQPDRVEALRRELIFDWERIPYRNLGRDDRVIGDTGKTARAPFIEESIVSFVQSLSPTQKCYFNSKESVGDKLLLRLCGYQLGLGSASRLKKRAIQFGSRIANKNQNAKDLSEHLVP